MRWLPAISGVVATASAAVVLVSMAQASPVVEPLPGEAAPGTTTGASFPVTTQTVETVVPRFEVMISGIDPAVSLALAEAGYSERVTPSEIAGQLDSIVAQALADSGAVLLVPNTGGG
jgi:hypothetical protein